MTEYCDPYTYQQIYGHLPPTDGSHDPALGDPGVVSLHAPVQPETKVIAPEEDEKPQPKRSRVAETK